MIIGNDRNVLNCAGGQRVGVFTFLRSGMTRTMLLRKKLIFILRIIIRSELQGDNLLESNFMSLIITLYVRIKAASAQVIRA